MAIEVNTFTSDELPPKNFMPELWAFMEGLDPEEDLTFTIKGYKINLDDGSDTIQARCMLYKKITGEEDFPEEFKNMGIELKDDGMFKKTKQGAAFIMFGYSAEIPVFACAPLIPFTITTKRGTKFSTLDYT